MPQDKVKLILSSLMFGSASLLLAGCYTVEGAGRDVAATGAGVAAAAETTRDHSAERPGPGSNEKREPYYRP